MPLYVHVRQAPPGRHARAADRAELLRRRVLHLPAPPVLPHHPAGVRRRRPRRRRRRVADPAGRSWSRSPGPRSPPSRCSASSTRGTTSSGRCSTPARTPTPGPLSVALANFRSQHHVQWNLTMAATVLFMLPVILLFFAGAEGLRAGRHADGGQGMKVVVVGRRRRRTRRSSCRASPTGRAVLDVGELVLLDPDRDRLEVVGAFAGRILGAGGVARAADRHRGPRRRARRGRRRPGAAARRRPGRPAARRDRAAGVRLHRAGDDRRRRPRRRRCAPFRSCSTWPRRSRRRAAAGCLDHRLHQPGGHRHAGAARRRAPGRRPVQRRDRAAADDRRPARRRAGAGAGRPGRAQPPDLDPAGAARRRRPAARAARPARRTRSPSSSSSPPRSCASSARSRRTTCATSTPTTPCSTEQRTGEPRAAAVQRDRGRAARALPRPRPW